MALSYVVDRLRGRVLTVADGLVTYGEVESHLDAEERDGVVSLPELVDARDALTDVTPDQVRRLVHRVQVMMKSGPPGPTAIVTDNDHFFGMARMYGILAEHAGAPVAVFRDIDAAAEWLSGWSS